MRYTVLSLLILIFLASAQGSFAQNKFSKAADAAYADQMFLLALQKYQKAYSKIKRNKAERDRISLRIAECYRMMNNTKRAESSYKRLVNNAKYIKDNPKILLVYADMLKTNGNYEEAIKQYTAYKENGPADPRADLGISTCTLAKKWIENPTKYTVKWEKLLNTRDDEFASAYADKKYISIIFTSDRIGAKGRDVDNWTGLGFSDLFFSRIDRKGDWSKPVLADQEGMINSKANDGVGQFNARFSTFYFTRCWTESKRKNGCAIMKATRQGGTNWSEPEKVDLGGDSTTIMGHPSVSSDETIFFSADLPGGFGGKDIWMAKKDKKGGRYVKVNLGPEINTSGDELFPFIRNDSILYFSSNGHPGMGGLDIFVSTRSKTGTANTYQWQSALDNQSFSNVDGATSFEWQSTIDNKSFTNVDGATSYQWQSSLENKTFANTAGATSTGYKPGGAMTTDRWTKPMNLKSPINSPADDFGIVFNGDELEQGLFSSNRPGGRGRDDIYSFVIPPVYYTLEGIITDDRTLQPIEGAKVRIVSTDGRAFEVHSDVKGHYGFNKMQILAKSTYDMLVTKKDYFNEKGRETTVGIERSKDLVRNFVLRPIPKKPVVLPDILYDLAKWDLKPQYRDSLQGLIETLDANENIVIELASHTDSRDSDERNDILSQKRAQSVVDYLISRGIDPDRLLARGYGERVPRALNKNVVKEGYTLKTGTVLNDSVINLLPATIIKEAAHQLNRRTEFSILRNDFVPKTRISKNISPAKIELVVNPEENIVPFKKTKEGTREATCFINGITIDFTFDSKEKEVYVSPVVTLKLLKDGIIDKTSFEGDPTKILGEGTVADKAVVIFKQIRIGKNTVNDVKATVNKKIQSLQFGDTLLKKFGKYSIDDSTGEIIFE
ncbi:MAG: OmpA family protein [Bacteroidales bacterium]|nr:OmpA family protein [Bacteroidales bacterium]